MWRSGRVIHIELCLSCRTRGKGEVRFCLVSAAWRPGGQGSDRVCAEEPPYCGAIDLRDRLCLVSVCRECTFTRQQAHSASERPAVSKPQGHLQIGGIHCRRKALLVSSQGQKESREGLIVLPKLQLPPKRESGRSITLRGIINLFHCLLLTHTIVPHGIR